MRGLIRAVRDWYRSLTDIKRDEWAPTALMFLYGFLALTSYYVIKPARNSVFVDRVGADNLPYVYLLTAVVVTAVMWLYSRYVERVKELALLLGTFGFLAANLVVFWWWLGRDQGFLVSGAFYIWGKLYPLLLVSQFYLVGNLIFTTRQARRLFGLIGVGLILGGIAGSTISGWVTTVVGTENLLLLGAGILALCAAIVLALADRMRGGREGDARLMESVSGDAYRLLRESSHLKTIAAILGLTIVVGTLIDWQFNSAVEHAFAGEDAKTAFFGKFFLGLNIASVLIQLLVTGFVLRVFGVGVAMLALPLGLLVASVGVLAIPALLTAVLAKGTEGALRYSLDQSTRELLYLPVPSEVKYKVKPLIDLAVYRGGTGLGGVLLIVLVNLLNLPWEVTARLVAATALGCIGLWIVVTVRMRREFKDSIKRLIGVRDVDLDELIVQRIGAEALDEARGALRRGRKGEILYALALLERYPGSRCEEEVAALLDHDASAVRRRAVSVLREMEAERHIEAVSRLLEDPSLEVRVEAIAYLCAVEGGDPARAIRKFLEDDDEQVRLAATGCMLRHGAAEQAAAARDAVERMARAPSAEARTDAARLLGSPIGASERTERVLETLLEDEADEVRAAALRAVGQAGMESLLPRLLEALASREDREAASEGLRAFGPGIHARLLERLADEEEPREVRRVLPRLFHPDAGRQTVAELLELVPDLEPELRFECLKTLNKLHRDREELEFGRHPLDRLVEREVRTAYASEARRRALEGEVSDGLLPRLLVQRRHEAVERATRALGLEGDQEDLYAAFVASTSEDALTRQRGFELLDNALPRRHARQFDPLLDPDRSAAELRAAAGERYGADPASPEAALRELAAGEDPWAALLARRHLDEDGSDPATANVAEELGVETTEEDRRIMEIVERADVLRKTEIFGELRVEDLAGLAALVEERSYREGDVLFHEEDAGTELFIVVDGCVAARRGGRLLFRAEAGETVGDLSLLDGLPRNYRAEATSDSRVLVLGREEFFDLMEGRFRIVRGLVSHLSGVIRRLNEALG